MMSEFPWEPMGNYKYVLFLPFAYLAATKPEGKPDTGSWIPWKEDVASVGIATVISAFNRPALLKRLMKHYIEQRFT